MYIDKTINKAVIETLSEIDELITSKVFSVGDKNKEDIFRISLEYSIDKLRQAETLFKGGKVG